jgi:hypothetical protein
VQAAGAADVVVVDPKVEREPLALRSGAASLVQPDAARALPGAVRRGGGGCRSNGNSTDGTPTEVREQYNAAVAKKRAAESALTATPAGEQPRQELAVVVASLGEVTRALERAEPRQPAEWYASLRLSRTYRHAERVRSTYRSTPWPTVWISLRVRGGT